MSVPCTDGIEVSRMWHSSRNALFTASEICRCVEDESVFDCRFAVDRRTSGGAEVE